MIMLVGRYRLVQPLDATQTAWRARDEVLHRDVTVRQIEESALPAVQAATVLRHPAVVTIHDVVNQDGRSWVVTELTEGASLATSGPMDEARTAAIGLNLLDAVASAHALGLVHGGIQPECVVLTADGQVKLTGFGTTRPHEAYTPPGQEVVPASDLWALAATLFTVAEGRVPFFSPEAVRHGQVNPPTRAPMLGAVLLPMLDPEPAGRPDADTVRKELRELMPGAPRKPWALRPVVVALAAVAIVAVVAPVSVFAALPGDPPKPAPVLAVPGTKESAGPVVPGRSKDFVAMPDACKLLTPGQAAKLVPEFDEPSAYQSGTCVWRSKTRGGDQPGSLQFDVTIRIELDPDAAEKFKVVKSVAGYAGDVADLKGLGDEALIASGLRGVEVSFRLANAIVLVQYSHRGAPHPRMKPVAELGARWAGEALNRV